jgi:hypothetical protein
MRPRAAIPIVVFCALAALRAQTGAGVLLGIAADGLNRPLAGAAIDLHGAPQAFAAHAVTRATGEFEIALPYGDYRVSALGVDFAVSVSPLRPTCVRISPGGGATVPCPGNARPWSAKPDSPASSIAQTLLAYEPAAVTAPLDFSWPASTAFPLLSDRAFSWTDVRYTLQGADLTDPYQPGRGEAIVDSAAVQELGVRTGFDLGVSPAFGSEIAAFVTAPGPAWRGSASTSDTGSALASDNLPAVHGPVQQTAKYQRWSNDSLQLGGPIGRRVEAFGSLMGEWSSQTVPLAAPGADLSRGLRSGVADVRAQLTSRDQLWFDFAGSRLSQPNWCVPAGIEAWAGLPAAPSFTYPSIEGFAGCAERDSFESYQGAWNRVTAGGLWQARASASWANLNTASNTPTGAESITDLATGATSGAPPLTNLATRTRQSTSASYARPRLEIGKSRHSLTFGAGFNHAAIRNRYAIPSGTNLITANGAPAYALIFYDTQPDFTERTENFTAYARDAIALRPWLTADVGAVADLARGGPVSWHTVSPRLGLAFTPGNFRRLAFRAGYARLYAPLAGRYLDFAPFNGLGGAEYQWLPGNAGTGYQPPQLGPLVLRFGAPFSSIDPSLRPPNASEFNVAAEASLPGNTTARAWLFRRDDRDRVADLDSGVPASDYLPIQIDDPGPDGLPGTFDDQPLTVYARQPSSFGQDRYLLTNPSGLNSTAQGFVLQAGSRWRSYSAHASFMAVETSGPANPGNSPLENDPGAIGALDSNPNAGIDVSGRQFFDRAYIGKAQFLGQLPRWLGGIEWVNTVNYMDGAPFARELVVAGLPQGPILVDATVHGSPGGGNRAEHAMNWNLRLARSFAAPRGQVKLALDAINMMNSNHKILENAVTGTAFNERLPLALEPARYLRLTLQYAF